MGMLLRSVDYSSSWLFALVCYYQESQALLCIDTLDVLHGSLPRRALNLAVEWALAHRDELRDNWKKAEAGESLSPVAPLE